MVVTALGTGLVVALALVSGRDLVVFYHVGILRQNPGSLDAWAVEPAGSIRGDALRRFLETPAGRRALGGRCLQAVLEFLEKDHPGFRPDATPPAGIVQLGVYTLAGHYLLVDGPSTLALPIPPESRILVHEPFFERIGEINLELDDFPGIAFTIWGYTEEAENGGPVLEVRWVRATAR